MFIGPLERAFIDSVFETHNRGNFSKDEERDLEIDFCPQSISLFFKNFFQIVPFRKQFCYGSEMCLFFLSKIPSASKGLCNIDCGKNKEEMKK